jgi:hypothetical protein
MKLFVDTDKVDKDIGVDGLLYLTALYLGCVINKETIDKLNNKGLIFINSFKDGIPDDVSPTKESAEIVEGTYANMEISGKEDDDRFNNLADKLRELFPTGRKPGTQLQWRDSTKIIAQRLKIFVKKFDVKFTDEQAIEATKKYISGFNGNYQFMQVLKYFIMKAGKEDGTSVVNSQLLSYMENTDCTDNFSDDWTSTLK